MAGALRGRNNIYFFNYGRSYLDRPDAVALYLPELPLRPGRIPPRRDLNVAGVILDAAPDAWGQRVILQRTTRHAERKSSAELDLATTLLESGSDRVGALDFQNDPEVYIARTGTATLDELAEAADRVDAGEPLSPELEMALLGGSSLGGTRPKATLDGDRCQFIAKFSARGDTFSIVRAEAVAMELARRVGLDVAQTTLTESLGRDVLVVERFDRTATPGARRMMVSALTMLELPEHAARHATYHDLADTIKARFSRPQPTLRELFARIVFNVCVGNTDDHARNHAAFWNGTELSLTPAYDICPYPRAGGEATQAMAIARDGNSLAQLALCVDAAPIYGLSPAEARDAIDHQLEVIESEWEDAADLSRLTTADR
ncbi:MAG: HipA domain-containing protein, partial [Acidimicrobiia bacterium]